MIEFVRAISTTAKMKASQRGMGPFFVVAQNAEELLSSAAYRAQQEIEFSAGSIGNLLKENKPCLP